MRSPRRDPTDWRPNEQQHALLKVALAPPTTVAEAWRRHREDIPVEALDTLDWGARRLVPLVAWCLRDAGVDDDEVVALRVDLASSMLAARVRLASAATVLEAFGQAEVDVLVLKGTGIVPLAYPDPGTRPGSDLDVLVRHDQLPVLDRALEAWGSARTHRSVDAALLGRYRHAAEVSVAGGDVDVHWRLLVDRFDDGPDDAVFDRAREVSIGGVQARTLSVEDHVVHAIAHGVRRNTLPPVRWIADVARLVGCQPVDWSVVEEEAERRHVAGVVGQGLDLLVAGYDVPVPEATVRALRRAGRSMSGRLDLWSRSPKRTRVGGAMNAVLVHYVLASRGWRMGDRFGRYPEYLRFRRAVLPHGAPDVEQAGRAWHG